MERTPKWRYPLWCAWLLDDSIRITLNEMTTANHAPFGNNHGWIQVPASWWCIHHSGEAFFHDYRHYSDHSIHDAITSLSSCVFGETSKVYQVPLPSIYAKIIWGDKPIPTEEGAPRTKGKKGSTVQYKVRNNNAPCKWQTHIWWLALHVTKVFIDYYLIHQRYQ